MVNKESVLIATPSTYHKSYALASWVFAVKHLTYQNYDVVVFDNSDDGGEYAVQLRKLGIKVVRTESIPDPVLRITNARNIMRQYAIDHEYDYLLSLESDVIPPLGIIEQLLANNKPYVTTVQRNYFIHPDGNSINAFIALARQGTGVMKGRYPHMTEEELQRAIKEEGPLIRVDRSHLGCVLISTDLLRQIVFRPDSHMGNDYLLCDDLRTLGYKLYCDTTVHLCHVTDGSTHKQRRQHKEQEKKQFLEQQKIKHKKVKK